jgi:hypothetical protein
MSRLVWAAVLAPVLFAVFGLRWALADFLLDRFGLPYRSGHGARADTHDGDGERK